MSALPWQTSVSPQNIASGTAHSFFLPAGGVVPPPPPPSTISTLADIQVSSITFGDTVGGFPTSGQSLYKTAAAAIGGGSSTILGTYSTAPAGHGSLYLDSVQLLGNVSTVFTSITDQAGTLNFNGSVIIAANSNVTTCSSITTGTVNNAPYIPQPLTHFGQDVIGAGGTTVVSVPRNDTSVYAIGLGGSPSTFVTARLVSTFTVAGPVGSNFSWITVSATQ